MAARRSITSALTVLAIGLPLLAGCTPADPNLQPTYSCTPTTAAAPTPAPKSNTTPKPKKPPSTPKPKPSTASSSPNMNVSIGPAESPSQPRHF